MLQKDIELLKIQLPENILKAKWCGDFTRAFRLIDLAEKDEKTPDFLKKRLLVEKEILERSALDFNFTEEEAVKFVQKDIPDFSLQELNDWIDKGAIQWIYVDGKLHLHDRFYECLLDNEPSIARRAGKVTENFEETPGSLLKNRFIQEIKSSGRKRAHIRIKAQIQIKEEAFTPGNVLVHLPIPKPQINMGNIRILRTFPENSEECAVVIGSEDQTARTVSFRKEMKENHPFFVEYEYDSTVCYHDLSGDKDSAPVPEEAPKKGAEDALAAAKEKLGAETLDIQPQDLQEIQPHVMFTPTIQALCEELSKGLTTDLQKARAFYDYVTTKVSYSYMRQYITLEEITEYAALGLKGDCGVQALLFITLCRAAGIPARWQSGLYVTPNIYDQEGNLLEEVYAGMHDWAMFYLKEYGWLFADCSFGGSAFRSGNLERWNYYFGNLDTFRMAANDAFQAPLIPEKKQTRFDPYDNQVGEIEYDDRPVSRFDMDRSFEVRFEEG